jgi:CDGSH-type Zn-finger protein
MRLAYENLIQPYIVKQVSKNKAYCMCGRTKNPPFCDGSHVATSITPHVIEVDSPRTMALCRCWKSRNRPFCDGMHGKLVVEKGNTVAKGGE